jgi:hypothetical protein
MTLARTITMAKRAARPTKAARLERANQRLDRHDLMVMQQSNGRYSVWKIGRGEAYGGYDKYTRVGNKSYSTVREAAALALKAVRTCV